MTPCPHCRGVGHIGTDAIEVSVEMRQVACGWSDAAVFLTEFQTAIMAMLVKRMPYHVERDAMIRKLWGADEPEDAGRILRVHIYHLRQRIEVFGLKIIPLVGAGYYLARAPRNPSPQAVVAEAVNMIRDAIHVL